MLQALVIGTALNAKGRPFVPEALQLLQPVVEATAG
jgi:hypothetical protein